MWGSEGGRCLRDKTSKRIEMAASGGLADIQSAFRVASAIFCSNCGWSIGLLSENAVEKVQDLAAFVVRWNQDGCLMTSVVEKRDEVLKDIWRCLESGNLPQDFAMAADLLAQSEELFGTELADILVQALRAPKAIADSESFLLQTISSSPKLFERTLRRLSRYHEETNHDPILLDAARSIMRATILICQRRGEKHHHLYPATFQPFLLLAENLDSYDLTRQTDLVLVRTMLNQAASLLENDDSRNNFLITCLLTLPRDFLGRLCQLSSHLRSSVHVRIVNPYCDMFTWSFSDICTL